jgi:D-threo-aldose 1-dehydrogenase
VTSVIPGAARQSEVVGNIEALKARIPAGFWSDLKAQGLVDPDAPVPDGAAA